MQSPRVIPLEEGATIASQLQKLAEEDPDKTALIFWDKDRRRTVLTRQQVWDKSRKFAAILHRRGIVKGDVVCNTLVNSPERFITNFGTILAGAASMHGQVLLADGEDIIKNWTDSKCKMVILDPTQKRGAHVILDRLRYTDEASGKTYYRGVPDLSLTFPVRLEEADNTKRWFQTLDDETEMYVDPSIQSKDIAFIFVTSGSTGFAKLVPLSHGTVLETVRNFEIAIGVTSESVLFNHRSLGWIGGVPINPFVGGNTRVLIDFAPGQIDNAGHLFVEMMEKENCDRGLFVPTDIQAILQALDSGAKLTTPLKGILTGGAPVSRQSMAAIGRFTQAITAAYGSTEAGAISYVRVEDPASYENGCVGTPLNGILIKILGRDGEELPAGQTGEIYIRSRTVAKEYMNNPEMSKETFLEDGWHRTSDIGHINDKGQLFVYCRKSNNISHKTYIIYPGWMESRVKRHPGIQNCVAVGIPDPATHEEICLCLIRAPQTHVTADEVREVCKQMFLTSEKEAITPIPKFYLFFDAFPLNSNGKLDRKALKAEALRRLESDDNDA